MHTLNLSDLTKSEIKYKISHFPDGQKDIVIERFDLEGPVIILSRFTSGDDLLLIVTATKALRRVNAQEIVLFVPYLLGARSDRQFQEGGTSYLVDVIAPIINSLEFMKVISYDVHSDVAAACINNFYSESNTEMAQYAINNIKSNNFVIVSPDGGSLKKIYSLANELNYQGEILTCNKHRSINGKLSDINVPITMNHENQDLIIVDDICDGGATFIKISEAINEVFPYGRTGKLYLVITHGIFSKGLEELNKHFDCIYTTNSYKDIEENEKLKVIDLFN